LKTTQCLTLLIACFPLLSSCAEGGAEAQPDAGSLAGFDAGVLVPPSTVADAGVIADAAPPFMQDASAQPTIDAGGSVAGDDWTCGALPAGTDAKALHRAAQEVLTNMTPCGFSSCHSGNGKAGLTFSGVTDLRTHLVGKMACEAAALPLIDGSGGSAALTKSWLWLKLASMADAETALLPDASWGISKSCGQRPDQPYGLLMPLSSTIDKEKVAPIRAWICAGAPGP
jgi:hypothetical protein